MDEHVTLDFETRSEIDLKKVGAGRYAEDPSTEVKMMCWAFGDEEVNDWIGDCLEPYGLIPSRPPERLFRLIEEGVIVEAHNAFFERMIWRKVMVRRYGWPDIPDYQWRCSAAKAASASLPRALGDVAHVLRLADQKDAEGHRLMLKLCKPRPAWIKTGKGPKYFGSKEEFLRELEYCRKDVRTERAVSKAVPEMPESEWGVWLVDQSMNERGILVDVKLAHHVISMLEEYRHNQRLVLQDLTGGEVLRETKRKDLLNWFLDQDVVIDNTQANTLQDISEQYPDDTVGTVAAICRMLNKSSVSKYNAMINRASQEDGRVRDTLMYSGAGTGRWSGRGVQFQNLPGGKVKDMDALVEKVRKGDLNTLLRREDNFMELASLLIRGAVMAPEGRDIIAADQASVEARGVMWEAGQEDALQVFERGEDIYCYTATDIYGYEVVPDPENQPPERKLGKQAVLGLGYQMGPAKFLATCEGYRIDFTPDMVDAIVSPERQEMIEKDIRALPIIYFPDTKGQIVEERVKPLILAKHVVEAYRTKYPKVVQLWHDCEAAAKRAIEDYEQGRQPKWVRAGERKKYGNVYYRVHGRYLICRLPSGRLLYYPFPRLKFKKTAWGQEKETITYMGVDSFTKKWCEQTTYGGKLVENITQAVCRDLIADALVALELHPDYDPILSVHDEVIVEVDEDEGSLEEVIRIMENKPKWAGNFPVKVEGWRGKRYRK